MKLAGRDKFPYVGLLVNKKKQMLPLFALFLSFLDCHGNPVRVQDLLLSASVVESSDCLIEGSVKDRVSHFTLR